MPDDPSEAPDVDGVPGATGDGGHEEHVARLERALADYDLFQWLDIDIVAVESGRAVLDLPFDDKFANISSGTVHGGITATVIDTASGFALRSTFEDPAAAALTTTDMNVRYVRPARGDLRVEAEVVRSGSSMGVTECEVTTVHEGERKVVATGGTTYRLFKSGDEAAAAEPGREAAAPADAFPEEAGQPMTDDTSDTTEGHETATDGEAETATDGESTATDGGSDGVFHQVEEGETDRTGGRTITDADIANFAGVSGDFNHLHMDAEAMEESMFGQRIAHGTLVFSAATGLLWQSRTPEEREAVVAFYGVDDLRFRGPVFPGDTIHVETEVLEKRETDSPRGTGTIKYAVEVKKQDGSVAISCEMLSLVE